MQASSISIFKLISIVSCDLSFVCRPLFLFFCVLCCFFILRFFFCFLFYLLWQLPTRLSSVAFFLETNVLKEGSIQTKEFIIWMNLPQNSFQKGDWSTTRIGKKTRFGLWLVQHSLIVGWEKWLVTNQRERPMDGWMHFYSIACRDEKLYDGWKANFRALLSSSIAAWFGGYPRKKTKTAKCIVAEE